MKIANFHNFLRRQFFIFELKSDNKEKEGKNKKTRGIFQIVERPNRFVIRRHDIPFGRRMGFGLN